MELIEYDYLYKTKPREHQARAHAAAWGKKYFAFYMEQGTGKSKVAIDLVSNIYKQTGEIDAVLLIAPSGVHEQWFDEQLPEHSPIPYSAYLWEGYPSSHVRLEQLRAFCWKEVPRLKWFCVNIEAFSTDKPMKVFRSYLRKNKVAIIMDEATLIKNPTAKCTINIAQELNDVQRNGKRIERIFLRSVYRFILTGTMVTNNPFDQYSYGQFLYPGLWKMSHFAFKAHYGLNMRMKLPGRMENGKEQYVTTLMRRKDIEKVHSVLAQGFRPEDIAAKMHIPCQAVTYLNAHPDCVVPYKNLSELKEKMSTFSFSVLKKDCYDLPEKQHLKVPVYLSAEQQRVYKELVKNMYAEYDEHELDVTIKLTLLMRLSQVTGGFFPHNEGEKPIRIKGNGKLEAIKRELQEQDGAPLIIAARFTAELELLREEIGAELIYGNASSEERRELLNRFKAGEVPILGVQPECVKFGFNLQVSHEMWIYSNDFSLDTREQLEDRIHRDGQTATSVTYRDFIAKGTIDERVYEVLREKKELLEYMRETEIGEFYGTN